MSTPGDGTIDTWLWYFGDGNTSSAQNTQHPYNSSNLYNVSLVVTDNNECSSQVTHYGLVSVAALPVVYFYADNTNNCSPPLDVYFTSNVTTSFGLNSYYSWDFGDGHTSTAANPSNTYRILSYNVCYTKLLRVFLCFLCGYVWLIQVI